MFPLNLHIIFREGDAGSILGGMEAILYIFLPWSAGIWVMKTSTLARASLKASLVDFESLSSSQRVILAEYWPVEPGCQSGKVLGILPRCPLGEL